MYVKNHHNLASKKLEKVTYSQKIQVLSAFMEVCEVLGVKPDSIYKVVNVDNISINDLTYIISFITIYNNIEDIHNGNDIFILNWFFDSKSEEPFNFKSPLDAIMGDKVNILKIRLYTNSLRVYLWEIMNEVNTNDKER